MIFYIIEQPYSDSLLLWSGLKADQFIIFQIYQFIEVCTEKTLRSRFDFQLRQTLPLVVASVVDTLWNRVRPALRSV